MVYHSEYIDVTIVMVKSVLITVVIIHIMVYYHVFIVIKLAWP